jgi:hypothetical protein
MFKPPFFNGGTITEATVFDATTSYSRLFTRADASSVMSSGGSHCVQGVICLTGDELLAKLDSSANNIFDTALPQNTFVSDVVLLTGTAAGSAATINVGSDANWALTASTADAWISALNANTPGAERTSVAGNTGQNGDLVTGATGNLTITSSADISGSSWEGQLYVFYTASEAIA